MQHSYELAGVEESKIIGIYSSRETAESIFKYKEPPGFQDYSNESFIDEYELDTNNWKKGFISSIVLEDEHTGYDTNPHLYKR